MAEIPSHNVTLHLDEIANRLWSENAVVMVGAGFSRNAMPVDSTSRPLPGWKELGDILYKKLHGCEPRENARWMSVPRLAEQAEALIGRPALDDLLRLAIPDSNFEPSPLHSQLLSLPWKDVFTTNYDTLLERASTSVPLKRYSIVQADEHLPNSNQPRIVKLHGTLPCPPFVITEEDYRRYPSVHAPFVNTVRQSFLENTLCLIGFSGDDPNFLNWIGWIRDHLGRKSAPKIYLVGVFDPPSDAVRKLLDSRGIVAVNLSEFNTDHAKAADGFLNYLKHAIPVLQLGLWLQKISHSRRAMLTLNGIWTLQQSGGASVMRTRAGW